MEIKIKLLDGGKLPVKKTDGSACYDCYARLNKSVILWPLQTKVIPLGFKTEFDDGYYIEVRGRSGNACKGLWVNTGTVDSDYRGELGSITLRASIFPKVIRNGDRIAQIMVKSVIKSNFVITDNLSNTVRGTGGFGSTGVK